MASRFASRHGVDVLTDNVQLILAAMDLKVVSLLRGAMRAADIASGRMEPATALGPAPTPPPPLGINPEPVYEPRVHIHPMPLYEPRPVIHLEPRVETSPTLHVPSPVEVEPTPSACSAANESPLLPPWKTMPWQNPPQPPARVKIVLVRPDIINKGSLLDFFI
jgi:hypothetical protein